VDCLGLLLTAVVHPADVQDRDGARWVLGRATVLRPAGVTGFVLLPRRWVVERTFAWLSRYRRLSKDYEYLTPVSETLIVVAMIHVMARRTLKD
jgi:putative transposase